MIVEEREVDMSLRGSRQKISSIASRFKAGCTKLCVSRRAWREGGRLLRREIKRKECNVSVKEVESLLILTYTYKKGTVGICHIQRNNWDPESSIMNHK